MREILIHMLSVKGFARPEILAEALACERGAIEAALAALLEEGLVEETRMGARLSEAGKSAAAAGLAAQRELGDARAMEAIYASFDGINRVYKAALADWQMREGPDGPVPNDHGDADYDAAVMARMFAPHQELQDLLRKLAVTWPLIAHYADRLGRARQRVAGGDQRFLAAPLIDSYHTVWFELHEALIRLSGRDRASEAAAGRAV